MKLNIRQRVFRLVLSAGVLTFVILGVVSLIGISAIRYNLSEKSGVLKEYSSEYIQQAIIDRQKSALVAVTLSVAQKIEQTLRAQKQDVQYLADAMTVELKKSTSGTTARNLINGNEGRVPSGRGYVFYVPELRRKMQNGLSPALEEEINRAGNIVDFFIPFGNRYKTHFSTFQAASKNGYFICVENRYSDEDVVFDQDFLDNYDFRVRPWYIVGKDANEPTFTDVYIDTEGDASFACVMAYRDGSGDFGGVISIAYGLDEIARVVPETAVGEDGFGFILDSRGSVILSAQKDGVFSVRADEVVDLRKNEDTALAEVTKKMTAGEQGVTTITYDGEEYCLAYAPMPASGWSFGTLMSSKTVLQPAVTARDKMLEEVEEYRDGVSRMFFHLFVILVALLGFLLGWLFLGSSRVSKRFVEPIQKLSEGVKEIATGNLDKKIDVNTGDELEELSDNINTMTDELKKYMKNLETVTAAEQRIATELKVATNIQINALPHDFPKDNDKFELYATMHAAKEVGGDFYDFYMVDENHLVITIADVSGKGVPAALFMMQGKTILKNLAMTMQNPDDLAAVMTLANNQLCQGNDEMMFITVFLAMLDLKTGKLIYVNGGHNPPMLYHESEKKFSWLKLKENCVLGLMDEMFFEQQETQMDHGDILYLYTDGVTEAMSETREQYGEDRLENCLNNLDHKCNLQNLLEGVSGSLAEHVKDAEQSDDITMLAVRLA